MRSIGYLMISASLVLAAACSHAQPAPAPAAPPTPVVVEAVPPPEAPLPEPVAPAAKPEIEPVSVYFDYDTAELTAATRTVLQAFFDQAQQQPDVAVRIEGNCDDRGTREYNIALGQKRAAAAKNYLVDLGFPAGRITTISYGKEQPRATGEDESARQENRRDDLIPTTTGSALSSIGSP
jgi:peptidoglycan-associated lipoprotein